LHAVCDDYARGALSGVDLALPGPTGERNSLQFLPRGEVLCAAETEAELLLQIAAVLASGNRIMLERSALRESVVEALPAEIIETVEWIATRSGVACDAVLAGSELSQQAALRAEFAGREGALIPVLTPQNGRYALYRLLKERCISVNTTAAGGNTALMTLAV
jgi:RHH-type proline utilization regulon transcriptional repressor/proline dehydrogenase/delta 1-pyrroline-5-carboxylate dehydrogenase